MTTTMSHPATERPDHDDPALSRLYRKLVVARHDLDGIGDRTIEKNPHGCPETVRSAGARLAVLTDRIRNDASPARHRRISTGQRWLRRLLPVLDGAILCWFLVGVLNVDLRTLDPTLGVAVALALLGTIALAAWSAIVGEHLARFVDHSRRIAWAGVDAVGWGMLVMTTVVWGLLAAMMWIRVRDEVFQATGVLEVGGAVIAAALAAAVVVVNVYVLYLSWSDGSDETREAEQLGRALIPHLRTRQRLGHRVADLTERVAAKEAALRATDRRRGWA